MLADLHRHHPGLRLGRTGLVFEALLPTILEQKVPSVEAYTSYAQLVRALGEPAPGNAELLLPPEPARLLATPYWAVHRFGIERRRFAVIQTVAAQARRLEATADMDPVEARRLLMTLPGIGPWSAAEVSAVAYGDRDVVSLAIRDDEFGHVTYIVNRQGYRYEGPFSSLADAVSLFRTEMTRALAR